MKILPPTPENIDLAAKLLREGQLIGMPTETVYGIAANALDVRAVLATFSAKGRPSENPLIVHVSSIEQAKSVCSDFPPAAESLAKEFWPGPLTLVLPKSPVVPSEVTAGLQTVAVRMPSHPVARALIEKAGVPVSAPSANRFMSLSPTSAHMIDPEIANALEMILDGGPCDVGIESTVLDLAVDPPVILRPGQISKEQIERVLGKPLGATNDPQRKSPGMYPKHYAPKAPAQIVDHLTPGQAGLTFEKQNGPNQIVMPRDATAYARELYQALFDLDRMRIGTIYIQSIPETNEWNAVRDRVNKIVG